MKTIMMIGEKLCGWLIGLVDLLALLVGMFVALPELARYIRVSRL